MLLPRCQCAAAKSICTHRRSPFFFSKHTGRFHFCSPTTFLSGVQVQAIGTENFQRNALHLHPSPSAGATFWWCETRTRTKRLAVSCVAKSLFSFENFLVSVL
ncbi:hypothetical protein SORBI_3002G048900 [Sorghum bicolor]|uniref:Uncharacterized protein n=1 Tax=Sorghum bicolor TaxID=4558 RepID=A0A1B6Q995_SORBI|nr:hypothetical protein SORBI_3002G048900 [Sorghum bicolor]